MRSPPPRALSTWMLACVAGFVALEVIAMAFYPGGTFWDRTTRGARFWQNFLCDLEAEVAINGERNPLGSRIAETAMLLMVAGLLPFWLLLPRLFASLPRLGIAVRILGLASLGGIVAVSLLPSQRFGALHGAAVIVAGAPGVSAGMLGVVGLAQAEAKPRIAASLGAAMLTFALVDFALYVKTMLQGGPGPILLPVAQKVALLLLISWILVVGRRATRIDQVVMPRR